MRLNTLARVATALAILVSLARGQAPDVVGEWVVGSPSAADARIDARTRPAVVYTLTPNSAPQLAMARKDLGYAYSFSLPTITMLAGTPEKPIALGFLQHHLGRRFEGELATSGCWMHLTLEASDDGLTLAGSARINLKISTRQCLNILTKDAKKGIPFGYVLSRRR